VFEQRLKEYPYLPLRSQPEEGHRWVHSLQVPVLVHSTIVHPSHHSDVYNPKCSHTLDHVQICNHGSNASHNWLNCRLSKWKWGTEQSQRDPIY
jgi:hypothetical protein